MELEKIGIGAYKPLKGFMTKEDFYSVVNKMRLSSGELFPLPVILPILNDEAKNINQASKIHLYFKNLEVATMVPKSVFKPDFKHIYVKFKL